LYPPPPDPPPPARDTVLGAVLALARVGIHEVQVPRHHANPLESEGIEHKGPLPRRARSLSCPVILTRPAFLRPRRGGHGGWPGRCAVCGSRRRSAARREPGRPR